MSHNPNQEIYENNYSASQMELDGRNCYDKSIIEFKLRILRHYCSEKNVLDLCCGGGAYLLELLPEVKSISGLDFSRNLLKSLEHKLSERDEHSKAKIVKADANNLPFEAEAFDALFCYNSLYYIPTCQQVLQETYRVLKPNGIAIFEFGNRDSLATITSYFCYFFSGWAKPYHIGFSKCCPSWKSLTLILLNIIHSNFSQCMAPERLS